MKRTPLYEIHAAAGAKLVDFAGWEMPLQYSGAVDEYHAVRRAAGLFDVSHMGRLSVRGPEALDVLQRVTTNDVSLLGPSQSQYSMVCQERGGILDDVFVYRTGDDEYLVCVNASNREKLVAWFARQARAFGRAEFADRSGELAQLALQGPQSRRILEDLGLSGIASLKPRHCTTGQLDGASVLVTRTGYTGELGYELYLPSSATVAVWNRLMAAGKPVGLKPAGLGSRDLLRLEMGYLLYGNDISEETTPLEAGAGWIVKLDKGDFIGRDALARQRQEGPQRRLVAFELLQKAVPRHGCPVLRGDDGREPIGEVTSGNLSPLLQKGIGLAYVPADSGGEGGRLTIDIRGKLVPAVIVKPPFYKKKG